MNHIRPHVHEAKTYLHFRDYGLSPYWTLRNLLIHELDGEGYTEEEIGGTNYEIKMAYSDSGIAPRPSDTVERDVLRDWEIHVEDPREDSEAKVHFEVRARYDGMKGPDGEDKSLPWEGGEGIDVQAQSSNIELDKLPYMLRRAIDALAESVGVQINQSYFTSPRPSSKITTLAYYVRIGRDPARQVVDPDGILHRIMYLLSPVKGTEWVYKGDNTDIVGHRHGLALPPGSMSELGMFTTGVRLKSYHPKHARDNESEDDPLSSPKFEVAYHKSIDGNSRRYDDRDELRRELEEILINSLEWAEIDTSPTEEIYVEDDHFSVEPSSVTVEHRSDPTPQIEANQESLLMSVLGEISPAGREVTKELATDGGTHYQELADRTDRSVSTIYRVLDELKGVVESDRGMIKFSSQKIRQEITGMVDRLNELKESTAERVAQLANVDLRSRADSALEKWAAKYGAEIAQMDGDGGTLRFDTLLTQFRSFREPHVEEVLKEGVEAWTSVGRDRDRFCQLAIDADLAEGGKATETVGNKIRW